MDTKEKQNRGGKLKKSAAVSAVALLTAASVTAGSLFSTPAALLTDDGASTAYTVSVDPDGLDDDDAGAEQDENGQTKKRGGVRAILRERILRLPLLVRLLVVLPLWGVGSVLIAAASSAWPLIAPVLGKLAGWALLLALLALAFLAAVKTAFPDLPLKKLCSRRNLAALLLGASALGAADAVCAAAVEDYGQIRNVALSVGFLAALLCVTLSFALREQKRRLAAPGSEPPKKPAALIFTDGAESYTVRVSE